MLHGQDKLKNTQNLKDCSYVGLVVLELTMKNMLASNSHIYLPLPLEWF